MTPDQPLLLYFPQWQGTGPHNRVEVGARALRAAFADFSVVQVPLSNEPLAMQHRISGYAPLLAQFGSGEAALGQQRPDRLLLLAGDCAAEIAPIHYLNQRYDGALTVLWLDAHADLNTPQSSPSGHFHGMPLRLLLEGHFTGTGFQLAKPLTPKQVVFVGLREPDAPEAAYIAAHGLPVLTDEAAVRAQLASALAGRAAKPLYIHLDLDVLNPAEFPALECPSPGGFGVLETARLLRQLIDTYHVVGLSLTETTATSTDEMAPIRPILEVYRYWLRSQAT